MLHLRLIVPTDRSDAVVDLLCADPGVGTVTRAVGAAVRPAGDVITADVAREVGDRLIVGLRELGVDRDGAITLESVDTAISAAAERAEAAAPGHGSDALVWEEVEARARDDAALTPSFLLFMAVAAIIAAAGILTDSPVLIVGAMVVGPDFGPVAALCVGVVRDRWGGVGRAARTLGLGLLTVVLAALVLTVVLRATGVVQSGYRLDTRGLTAFISHPDGIAAVVAFAAGVAGMLTITEDRAGALIGVLVSVTTIPAAANLGVAIAVGNATEAKGSLEQLGVNIGCLVVAGSLTLAVQAAIWSRVTRVRQP